MNKSALQSIHSRDAAYRVYFRVRSPTNLLTYKKLRNETKRLTRLAKRKFFICSSRTGMSSFWKNVKSCTGLSRIKAFLNPWPCATSVRAFMSANKLNIHFVNFVAYIATNFRLLSDVHKSLTEPPGQSVKHDQFAVKAISYRDVLSAINEMSSTSSTPFDGITSKMLKFSASAFVPPLATLFNNSIRNECFLSLWKSAIITPVHKKGDFMTSQIIALYHCSN